MADPNVSRAFTAAAAADTTGDVARAVNSLPAAALQDCVTYRALVAPVAAALRRSGGELAVAAADAFVAALDERYSARSSIAQPAD